jgi:hypothetical protein
VLTGAFDPAWIQDGGGLLFTGYEAGAFQIFRCAFAPDSLAAAAAVLQPQDAAADSAWVPLGWEQRGAFSRQRYRRHLSLDVAQSQISQDPQLGTSGGIELALSDVLGNDQYYLVMAHMAGDAGLADGLNLTLALLNGIVGGYTGKGAKSVLFTPALTAPGIYQVFARWTDGSNRASNVPIDVLHSGGLATVTVDQRTNGGSWVLLGTWAFDAGALGSVMIRTAGADGYVVADAVRFVLQ